jgi:hypothetical protein
MAGTVPKDSVHDLIQYYIYIQNHPPPGPENHLALFAGVIFIYAAEKHERFVFSANCNVFSLQFRVAFKESS